MGEIDLCMHINSRIDETGLHRSRKRKGYQESEYKITTSLIEWLFIDGNLSSLMYANG
jgi:hypothetical protein